MNDVSFHRSRPRRAGLVTYAVIESTRYGGNGLNSLMDRYREV
jgi:hypothetical protein